MGEAKHNGRGKRARVTFRRVRLERAAGENQLTVLCTRRGQFLDVRECRECEHCRGLCIDSDSRELFLRCASPPALAAGMAREGMATLAEIATLPALCVGPDVELAAMLTLFDENAISALPVVDDRGMPIGIVSKTDVVRHFQERIESADDDGARGAVRARELMSCLVFTLPAEADVARAAALMAYEGVHHLVITGQDGRASGIVSSLDVLRWLARQSGYVVPSAN